MVWLFLVHFEGLAIWVVEEDEAFACRCIGPDVLVGNAHTVQFCDLALNIINLKGQVPQARCLGIGRALWG